MLISPIHPRAVRGAMAALGAAGLLGAAPLAVGASPPPAKIQLRTTHLGRVLANGSGFTVYVFTHDRKNQDTCVKISRCPGTWPVLRTNGKARAAKGVNASLLGTITLAHGVNQVTYAGHPLYGYRGDSAPGQTGYVGVSEFGGSWDAITAAGKLVR